MSLIRKIFRILTQINWIKTIYFNFKLLPIKQAIKLPVFFYGKVKFGELSGKLIIDAPITGRMIRFGLPEPFEVENMSTLGQITLVGTLVFKGAETYILNGYTIHIAKAGYVEIGEGARMGSHVRIVCNEKIIIGKFTWVTFDCQVIDTNFHHIRNIGTQEVKRKTAPIIIGELVWVGNRTSVMKGTCLPDHTIVASNSLVNSDFNSSGVNMIIGGIPSKVLKEGFIRAYNEDLKWNAYYKY